MVEENKRPKILIVFGYHQREVFAASVGEQLLQTVLDPGVKVVKYSGRRDRRCSNYNLRRFVKHYNPVISPIILHDGEDGYDFDMAIVYCAKSREAMRKSLRPLKDFAFASGDDSNIAFGRFLTHNAKCNLIDLELDSKMELEEAMKLVQQFFRYLLRLHSGRGITL